MEKLKLMTIIGTRPEIIRLSQIIKKCDVYFRHILVHTGQNYDHELSRVFFDDLGLRPADLYLHAAGGTACETIGRVIAASETAMREHRPDALLVLGDTNSCLAAIAAKRLHIPVFHMEAGNRCFDECLPEETNRRIVDHIADVNLCYSEHARRNLLAEGLHTKRIFVVGSPMAEVLGANLESIRSSDILARLGLSRGEYILLSSHREENIDTRENFLSLMNAVNAAVRRYAVPIVYACHPRSKKMIEASGFDLDKLVQCHKPFGFHDYNHLQINALAVLSDSGTLPEEKSFFTSAGEPFAAVCVRTSTERPEALEKGQFILAGIASEQVLAALDMAIGMKEQGDDGETVADYGDVNVSGKVVRLIQGMTDIIRREVWHTMPNLD